VIQHQAQNRLREKDEILQRQSDQLSRLTAENERFSHLLALAKSAPVPHLPAPPMRNSTPTTEPPSDYLQSSNIVRMLNGEFPKLTTEQVESYLKEYRRNAGSLLAVFRATGDESFLKEAKEKFPDDPRVAFAAVFKTDSPEERRQWLDNFKRSASDNTLASYLSALDYFKSGQTDQAVQELIAVAGKQQFQDYTWDFIQNAEEAWHAAGYPQAEASMIASWGVMLPHLKELKQLGQNMVDLASSYRQAGDEASAQAVLQMGLNLGQQMSASPNDPLVTRLVGMAIQRLALGARDPTSPYGAAGQTVQDRLDQLVQQRTAIQDLAKQFQQLQQAMSPQDWINYNDRIRAFGEESAFRWLIDKYGQR
jgi:hypothetical protein